MPLINAVDNIFTVSRLGYLTETSKEKAWDHYETIHRVPHPTDRARQQDAELLNADAMAAQLMREVMQTKPTPQTYQKATLYSCITSWPVFLVCVTLNLVTTIAENGGGKSYVPLQVKRY